MELMSQMRPGLIQLEIGVQSTNPETIRAIHRHMDLKKLEHCVNRVHSFEISISTGSDCRGFRMRIMILFSSII